MRIDQITDVFVKQLGARKDGPALLVPADAEAQLYVALENTKPGDRVDVVYYRGNKRLTAQVQLSDRAKAGIQN